MGRSRPRWHAQQVTTWRPLKLSRLIAATICTMRRAVRFLGVSSAQSTWSVPADGWQPTQSEPTAADMMPIVSRKSSTPMPFSAWTFLNTSSTINGFDPGARPPCAETRRSMPTGAASATTIPAAMTGFHPTFMAGPSRLRPLGGGAAGLGLLAEFLQAAFEVLIELRVLARIPVAAVARFAGFVEVLADVPQLLDVFSFGHVEGLESHVSERLDSRVPLDRVAFDFRGDLRRRQLDRVRAGAVVLVAGRRERPLHLEQVDAFDERDRAGADLVPVLLGLRLDVDRAVFGDGRADRVEQVVGDRIDHVLHQFLDRHDRLEVAPQHACDLRRIGRLGRRRRRPRRGTPGDRRGKEDQSRARKRTITRESASHNRELLSERNFTRPAAPARGRPRAARRYVPGERAKRVNLEVEAVERHLLPIVARDSQLAIGYQTALQPFARSSASFQRVRSARARVAGIAGSKRRSARHWLAMSSPLFQNPTANPAR